jgi:hypothetical protein
VVVIQIAAFCVTIPSTLIHIKDSGQPTASIFGSGKLYGYTKVMDRDYVGGNVKLDNLRSKGRRKLDSRDGGKEILP